MKKISILFSLISILITSCNLSNNSGNDEQIVSMQQTIDAMQAENDNNDTSQPQADPPTQEPPTQQPPTQKPPTQKPPTQKPPTTAPTSGMPIPRNSPTDTPAPLIPIIPLISSYWGIEKGVCRDDFGGYPRWSSYDWTFAQCEQACKGNPNCQGFAMSNEKDYCQLFGSDGANDASHPGTHITRGDLTYPEYTCYIKPYLK